jgi:peptide/nickel transport system permease protein
MRRSWLPQYVLRRLLLLVPLALLVTLVVFCLTEIVPGGPVAAKVGDHPLSPVTIAQIKHRYHLDEPIYAQYWRWLSGVVAHGDLGRSILTSEKVTSAIGERLWITVTLNVVGIVLAVLIGLPLGVLAAVRRGRPLDRALVGFAVFAGSAPSFVVSIALLYFFGLRLGWFPLFGAGNPDVGDRAWHLALPALVLGLHGTALVARITRASMLDQLGQDYVSFARARGLSSRRVVVGYALRNALIPVLTAAGLLLIGLLTAAVFVEAVFGLPGLGGLLVSAVQGSDVPVIQGLVLVIAIWIVLLNIVLDVVYALVDPRVGFERAAR